MSDFVMRLALRAAGIAPTAVPRPPDLPPELLVPEPGAEDEPADWPDEISAQAPQSPAAARERTAAPPSALVPVEPPAEPAPLPAAKPTPPPAAEARPLPAAAEPRPLPREALGPADPPSRGKAERAAELVLVLAGTPEPRQVAALPSLEPQRQPDAIGSAPAELHPRLGREAELVSPRSRPPESAFEEPETTHRPAVVRAAAQPPGPVYNERPPLPVVATAPSPAALAWPAAEPRAPAGEPSIQVHIGRVELVDPPLPVATPVRRAPRGFHEQELTRRHLDRRWY